LFGKGPRGAPLNNLQNVLLPVKKFVFLEKNNKSGKAIRGLSN